MSDPKKLYRLVYLWGGELHQLGTVHGSLSAVKGYRTRLRRQGTGYAMGIQVLDAEWKGLS